MIQLGSKIQLGGFEESDLAQMVVVRKLVGNLAKQLKESKGEYGGLEIVKQSSGIKIIATLGEGSKEITSEHENLFFALNDAFKQLGQ